MLLLVRHRDDLSAACSRLRRYTTGLWTWPEPVILVTVIRITTVRALDGSPDGHRHGRRLAAADRVPASPRSARRSDGSVREAKLSARPAGQSDARPRGPHPPATGQRREPRASYQYLLDLDVDLAEALDVRMRLVARPAATAFTFDAEVGDVTWHRGSRRRRPAPACWSSTACSPSTSGSATGSRPSCSARGICVEPAEAGDEELLACAVGWRALVPMRFALLDAEFAERVRPWPQIMQALLRRAERRAHNLNIQRAIACAAPARCAAGAAALASGRALGQGRARRHPAAAAADPPAARPARRAERPSVSHALARLSRCGLGDRARRRMAPARQRRGQLQAMVEPDGGRVEALVRRRWRGRSR